MNLNPERLHQAAISLASSGVTRFLPTLITASRERTIRQLKILAQAMERDPVFERMCLGVHLEGPYISPEDGPEGLIPESSLDFRTGTRLNNSKKRAGIAFG